MSQHDIAIRNGTVVELVSGVPIFENGEATGSLPGRLLRGEQASPTR